MRISIDGDRENTIEVGDLLYCKYFGTYIMIVKEKLEDCSCHEYRILELGGMTVMYRYKHIDQIVADFDPELVAKNSHLTLTNSGGR